MKTILLLALTLCSFKLYAQTATETDTLKTTEDAMVDSVFGSLDTNRMSTKYLLERTPVNFGVNHFNGLAENPIEPVKNTFAFYSIYASVYRSQVNGHACFIDPLAFADNTDSICRSYNETVVPVMMFMGSYNSIDTSAVRLGWVKTLPNSIKLRDAELPENPYDTFGVFAAMACREKVIGYNFNFQFSSKYFATNMPEDAGGTVEVDFGDGAGAHNIGLLPPWPEFVTLQANYTTQGNKLITITYTPPAGMGPKRKSSFVVYAIPTSVDDDPHSAIVWNIEGAQGHTNYKGTAYYYPGCDKILDKPLIIVEGLNIGNKLHYNGIYNTFNAQVDVNGQHHYLLHDLRGLGYDVIILQFNRNHDLIAHNSLVLEGLINYVNATKIGNDKLIIIGEGMGGLVTRYCLKSMEDSGVRHNVKLYISYDSPQQGAIVPLGMQYVFKYMTRDIPELMWNPDYRNLQESLASPAARQILIYHAPDFRSGTNIIDPKRTNFAAKLATLGYPTEPKMIAVTNGSQNGEGQNFGVGDMIFKWDMISGIIDIDAKAWCLQPGSHAKIASWDYSAFLPKPQMNILTPLTLDKADIFIDNTETFDPNPGGQGYTENEFVDDVNAGFGASVSGFNHNEPICAATDFGHPAHCYVPTVSALDLKDQKYGNQGSEWWPHGPSEMVSPPVIASQSPFSSVVNASSPSVNEDDMSMTNNIYTFLYDNIVGAGCVLNRDLGVGGFEYFNYAPGTPSEIDGGYNYDGIHNDGKLDIGDAAGDSAALQVNGDTKAGFPNSVGSVPPIASRYTLTVGGCHPDTIYVHNHATLIIGDPDGNQAAVHVLAYSSIILDTGATLEIYNHSTLTFEQSASLNILGNATIQLNGSKAVLDFDGGKLFVKKDVTVAGIKIKGYQHKAIQKNEGIYKVYPGSAP